MALIARLCLLTQHRTSMGRADSLTLRARKVQHALNGCLQLAVEAYTYKQSKPKHERQSLRDIASRYNVVHTTLNNHYQGRPTKSAFVAMRQKLTPAEENTLVGYALACSNRGFPITHSQLATFANEILEARQGPSYEPVGKNWTDRFIERHHQSLQMHWSKPLDSKRARALNPDIIQHWFQLVKEFIPDLKVKPENIYGMDESGFPPSDQGRQRVIGRRGKRVQHKHGGADRENVTAIVTIRADGTTLKPTIIFKGTNFMKKWGNNNISDAS